MPTFKPFETKSAQSAKAVSSDAWEPVHFPRLQKASRNASGASSDEHHASEFEPQSELKALREKARAEAYEEGLKQGRQQGYDDGYKDGTAQAEKDAEAKLERELTETLAPITAVASHFHEALERLDEQFAESVVQLALVVGKQLAGEALDAHPEQILALVRDIIQQDPFLKDRPTLLLNSRDMETVKAHLQPELEAINWKVRHDDKISRGGCRLVSDQGEIDATIETRWERITEKLRGSHGAS